MTVILMGIMGVMNLALLAVYFFTSLRCKKNCKSKLEVSDELIELLKE